MIFPNVARGLDPRVHPFGKMDRRVKPGDDANRWMDGRGMPPASRPP